MTAPIRVSLIVPMHNEQAAILPLHERLCTVFAGLPGHELELICIDDGSRDSTLERLAELVGRDRRVRVIELSRNFGKEMALTAGLDAATGEVVIPLDADLQDPPELIPQMLDEWARGAEVVLACRVDRRTDSWLKRSTADLFYRLHNRVSEIAIPRHVGDFRLLDRKVVDAIKRLPERQRFMKGLFAWVGFRTVTITYSRPPRIAGATKFSGWRLWNFAVEGITSFGTAPLRVWTYVGLIGAAISAAYAGLIVFRTLIHGVDVPGYASLLVTVLFFGSIQLISIGVLGEYIGRIYMEVKQRPPYIVRRTLGGPDGT